MPRFILSLLAVAGTAAATAPPTMRTGQHVAKVPWRRAGPGWSVVEYSAASLSSAKPGKTSYYLVSPKGRKHAFCFRARTPSSRVPPSRSGSTST